MQTLPAVLIRLWARLTGWWAFGNERRAARVLFGFACAEQQSQLELREAANQGSDTARRVAYLRHALDEARHAELFLARARELSLGVGGEGFGRPAAWSECLFERLGERRFLAFVHQGERRGRLQFEA